MDYKEGRGIIGTNSIILGRLLETIITGLGSWKKPGNKRGGPFGVFLQENMGEEKALVGHCGPLFLIP